MLQRSRSALWRLCARNALDNPPSPKGLPACKITSSSPLQSLWQIVPDSLVFPFSFLLSRGAAARAKRARRCCQRLPATIFRWLQRPKLAYLASSLRSWSLYCPSCSSSWRQDAPTSLENGPEKPNLKPTLANMTSKMPQDPPEQPQ